VSRPFLALARRALADVDPTDARPYLERLPERLERLGAVASGRAPAAGAPSPEVKRVVAAIEGGWHDGDENLVRGWLDRWGAASGAAATARILLEAVGELERIGPSPGTLRFFLWEMESVLAGLAWAAAEPAVVSVAPTHLLESSPQQPTHSRREVAMPKRILVVDDDENILSLERTILEQRGYVVTTAGGGEEALKLLHEQAFDLVLLDVMMPDKDGFEVCRQLKQDARTRELPVIFLTAKGGGEALAEGFESGAVMYINKPFTANKLLTIVNTMLEQTGQ
jgi:CheY-like chemotaxis protein